MDCLETSLRQFEVISKLGQGSFSCVYKVQRVDDKKMYAMKKVKIGQMKEKEKENALNEVRILASISHSNIVNYKEAFFDDKTQTLCIVMELADAGDIQKKINDHLHNQTHFTESEIWQAFLQMAKGLKTLHDINILHRDLKCANVFCTSDGRYKLGDLNVSKVAKRGMARTQTGTPYYTSPEVWNDKAYDSKCDIWSLGCVVYEMAALRPPFRASNLKELYAKIQKGLYQTIPKFYSDDLKNLIANCIKVTPSHRLSASQIIQHPVLLKNTPSSQFYSQENNQTSKCNLLKTILVPKNLKSLKEVLPGNKYDQPFSQKNDLQKKFKRANSANSLRRVEEIPRVLVSPKVDQNKKQELKYAFIRRPSSGSCNQHENSKEMHSERIDSNSNKGIQPQQYIRQNGRMVRNNSLQILRKRVDSQNSIDHERRRDNSKDYSRDNSKEIKNHMEGISNRCKEIQERMRNLMDKKKDLKEQRSPNLPSIKSALQEKVEAVERKYVNYLRPSSREKEEVSLSKLYNRNKSIEIQKNDSNIISSRNGSQRSMEKVVMERQRSNSREQKNRNGSFEKKIERIPSREAREFENRKRYGYGIPPKIKY